MDRPIKFLTKSDGTQRVAIYVRADGRFTYRFQWAEPRAVVGPDPLWGPMGPDCGIYDSADSAEDEAMQRVAWLKAGFH